MGAGIRKVPALGPGTWRPLRLNRYGFLMRTNAHPSLRIVSLQAAAGLSFCAAPLGWGGSAAAAIESGVYATSRGATVEERGDQVPNRNRVVAFSATVTIDLSAGEPSITAVSPNAVLEGGGPFGLTVRSATGAKMTNDTYRFTGDYLEDLYPSGTQYLFDWKFSSSTNGGVVWNGTTGWAGGHSWYVTIPNVTLVPQALLSISRVGTAAVQITWSTNFADHVLQYATSLPASDWSTVT